MSKERDERYLALAQSVASIFSKDPSTKVGAVIVGHDHRDVSIGYNGFPPGIKDNERLQDREVKNHLVIHAERNALDNARFNTHGATLYVTQFPCHECVKSIISKGLNRVIVPICWELLSYAQRWADSVRWAQEMLTEAQIGWFEV